MYRIDIDLFRNLLLELILVEAKLLAFAIDLLFNSLLYKYMQT